MNKQYIVVLGTSYSGSGAVFDYLAGRGDLYNPLDGMEYLLPQMPGGLMTLEASAGQAFHHGVSDNAVEQFKDLLVKLSRASTWFRYGKGYSGKLELFLPAAEKALDQIVTAKLALQVEWRRLRSHPVKLFFTRVGRRLGFAESVHQTNLLLSPEEVVLAAQEMHDCIFQVDDRSPVLLNQAGSGWNPIESTKYFRGRKVVLVIRDPRDQFAELKQFKKARDVGEFIKWYRALQHRIDHVDETVVLKMPFEEFVLNNEAAVEAICKHLGLSPAVPSSYEARISAKNIGKYRAILTSQETSQIEKALAI